MGEKAKGGGDQGAMAENPNLLKKTSKHWAVMSGPVQMVL